jgi:hypothetical protein
MMYRLQSNNKVKTIGVLAFSVVGSLLINGCNFSLSTATLENMKMCGEVGADKQCASDTATFSKKAPKIFATADLKYAPEGTKVKVDWKYLGGEAGQASNIDTVNLEVKSNMTVITSSLPSPEKGWPGGDYEVVISLDTDNSKPVSKKFSIASAK